MENQRGKSQISGLLGKSAGPGRAPPPQFQPVLSPDCDDVGRDAAADDVQYKVGEIIGHNVKKTADEIYRGQKANQTQKHHKAVGGHRFGSFTLRCCAGTRRGCDRDLGLCADRHRASKGLLPPVLKSCFFQRGHFCSYASHLELRRKHMLKNRQRC